MRDGLGKLGQRLERHLSCIQIMSPPDGIGYIKDCEFRTIYATYLGQPDPNLKSLVGRPFERKANN